MMIMIKSMMINSFDEEGFEFYNVAEENGLIA
jgi:hypothetical protein